MIEAKLPPQVRRLHSPIDVLKDEVLELCVTSVPESLPLQQQLSQGWRSDWNWCPNGSSRL